jgi:hypothetical protein
MKKDAEMLHDKAYVASNEKDVQRLTQFIGTVKLFGSSETEAGSAGEQPAKG